MLVYLQMIENEENQSKFEQLYEYYRGMMFSIAMNILKNQQDAEDAVHQAFLAVIENFKKISDIKCPKTRGYLVIITERKAIDIIRARSKTADTDMEGVTYGIEISIVNGSPLAEAMAKLPAQYREVLLLKYEYGYSAKEISELFGAKPDTTRKLIWRAKKALQKLLEDTNNEQ